ncbi:MAG: pyridoxamine 5'-phosphate oxidase family protein [Pseudomonadota bacterium]
MKLARKNNNICFEFDIDVEVVKGKNTCEWGMKYQSVIGFGKAFIIDNHEQKRKALNIIMSQYSENLFQFTDSTIDKTSVIKIEVTSMTGKRSGF